MATSTPHADTAARTPRSRLLVVVAWLVPIGIMLQAALAGQGWFVEPSLIATHGGVGHGVLGLSLIATVLAWWRRPSWTVVVLTTASLVGLIAQTGLGYTGRRGGVGLASSVHIPLGTLLFATTLVVAVLLLMDRDDADQHGAGR